MWSQRMPPGCVTRMMLRLFASRVMFFGTRQDTDQYPSQPPLLRSVVATPLDEPSLTGKRSTSMILPQSSKSSSQNPRVYNQLPVPVLCLPHHCCAKVHPLG